MQEYDINVMLEILYVGKPIWLDPGRGTQLIFEIDTERNSINRLPAWYPRVFRSFFVYVHRGKNILGFNSSNMVAINWRILYIMLVREDV